MNTDRQTEAAIQKLAEQVEEASDLLDDSLDYLSSLLKKGVVSGTYIAAVQAVEEVQKCLDEVVEFLDDLRDQAWMEGKPLRKGKNKVDGEQAD